MRKEELKASFEKIQPDKLAEDRMLANILGHSGKEKKMAFNFRKAIPAMALAVVITGGILAYKMLPSNTVLPPASDSSGNALIGREDMAAPLLNQFQLDNRHYIWLSDDNLRAEFGFPAELNENDIGEKIATITRGVDPGLIGCEVYRYKPAGSEAVVAVKKENAYLLFQFFTFESYNNNQDEDSIEYLKVYGINKAEDIAKVQFIVHTEQSKLEGRTDVRGEIAGDDEVARFYSYYSALKNSSDKYFDRLFHYRPAESPNTSVETDVPPPDMVPPDAIVPDPSARDTIDPVKREEAAAQSGETNYAEDSPLMHGGTTPRDLPTSPAQTPGPIDMGGAPSTGVGSAAPARGAAGDALSNPVVIRIYNQSGVYYDSYYYRNIGFISRYEVSPEFADFLNGYIK